MKQIYELLGKKYQKQMVLQKHFNLIKTNWVKIVGDLSQHIIPVEVSGNCLVVTGKNPAWMNEISFFKDEIIKKISLVLKQHSIKEIKYILSATSVTMKTVKKHKLSSMSLEERIKEVAIQRKKDGYSLCKKCHKMWDNSKICKLCQLTA